MLNHENIAVAIEALSTPSIVHAIDLALAFFLIFFLDLVFGGGCGLCLALLTLQGFHLVLAGGQLFIVDLVHREVCRLVQLHDTDHSNQADDSSETCSTRTYTRTSSGSCQLSSLLNIGSAATAPTTRTEVDNGVHHPANVSEQGHGGDDIEPKVEPEPVIFSQQGLKDDLQREGAQGD